MRLDPQNQIKTEQRAQIMIAVHNLAHLLEEHGANNDYSKVYSAMYRSSTS